MPHRGARQRILRDVRPPRDHPVLRPVGRSEAPARAVQEGENDQRVQGAVVQRVGQQGDRHRAQQHPRHHDRAEGTQGAGGAAEVAGLAAGVKTRRALSESAVAWLFVAPALLVIGLVVAFPLVYSLWLSFTDVNLLRATGPAVELGALRIPLFRWIGARNYTQVLADPLYWDSLWRTLYFVGAFVAEATVIGFAMALVLNERFPGRPLLRGLIYVLTMGGPGYDTTTISWHGFKTSFTFFKFGPGTAILYTLTALCLLMTVVYHRLVLARFEPEG